jgi:hypothetical protein
VTNRVIVLVGLVAAWAAVVGPARAAARTPVPSLTPVATARLWRAEVAHARLRRGVLDASCRPARVVVYAQTDWLRAATELAAAASPCAQYYVSVPPLASDKTQARSAQAAQIRALGSNFHALDEINYTGWSGWVASTGSSWYDAGVTARQRMAAAGFDVSTGDDWVLNELSSAVRTGAGSARRNALDFLHGLANDGTRGVVLAAGISQSTGSLAQYKVNLQDWLEDGAFWTEAASYVTDWGQETYGDLRTYAAPGTAPADRAAAMLQYLGHPFALAAAGPDVSAPARSLLAQAYLPFGSAAWAWSGSYGWTAAPVESMEDFVSGQVYADRLLGASTGAAVDRIGFAWAPSNSLGLSAADFATETRAVLDRIAAAVRDTGAPSATPGAAACDPSWCTTVVNGAALTGAWGAFSAWSPSVPVIVSPPLAATPGAASGPVTVQLQTLGLPDAAVTARTATFASSSPTGLFAPAPAGPWTPTLSVPIPVGSSSAAVYYLDSAAGSPLITATLDDGSSATQLEGVVASAPPPLPPPATVPAPSTPPAAGSAPPPAVTQTPVVVNRPAPVAHVVSVKTSRVGGHVVVTVRVRAGAKAVRGSRVLIRVKRGRVVVAFVERTTAANGVATWRSAKQVRPGRYSATAAVAR